MLIIFIITSTVNYVKQPTTVLVSSTTSTVQQAPAITPKSTAAAAAGTPLIYDIPLAGLVAMVMIGLIFIIVFFAVLYVCG